MQATTPRVVTPEIHALCRELVDEGQPRFVEVRPMADADAFDCFSVVVRQVEREGGQVCYGWRIWELPRVYVEAEFHAVWRDHQGTLIDITPRLTDSPRILFVQDPARVYEGRQRNNVRRALTSHPAIQEFFRAADDGFELMNRGARAEQHGFIGLSASEAEEWKNIETRKFAALTRVLRSLPKPGRNDLCPCGSGKKFKKCHGS